MNKKIDSNFLKEESTIKEAMESLNENGFRISLVVDKEKKLIGVVTDGDIRRALLSKKNLNSSIKDIIITNPIIASEKTPAVQLLELMIEKGINQIPIVDNQNIPIDIVSLSELKSIPLSSPDITYKEVETINQVLSTPFLSIGPKVKEFEKKIADFVGAKYAIAVNSGTSALHLCVKALGIRDGDEVITTPFSFIASANCMLFERAKPVFVDIDKDTLCIDVNKIEEKITPKTKAILPVHILGHACCMEKIMEISRKYNLPVIEDACEALGTEYKGKKVGTFGKMGVFSFYPNKPLTTSEGGLIVTDDIELAKLCQSMRNQGRDTDSVWLHHTRLGYNYRMSELSAALGVAQMERVEEILSKRQKVADLYNQKLKKIKGIKVPYVAEEINKMSWFVYVIRLDNKIFNKEERNMILDKLERAGISCRDYFPSIHLEPLYVDMFGYQKGDFPISEETSNLTVALPFYNNLTERQINYICEKIESIMNKLTSERNLVK
jgi:perosamine synthetase